MSSISRFNSSSSSKSPDFNLSLSLDAIYDVSFTKNITVDQIEDPYDLFDDGRGASLFDDAPAPFDGNDPTNATINLQVATSNSSLDAATEFFNMNTTTTYKGRYFKFRLRLANANNKTRAFVSGISVSVNMEKRVESLNDLTYYTVKYEYEFSDMEELTPEQIEVVHREITGVKEFSALDDNLAKSKINEWLESLVVQDILNEYEVIEVESQTFYDKLVDKKLGDILELNNIIK